MNILVYNLLVGENNLCFDPLVADDDLFCSATDELDCRFTYIYDVIGNNIYVVAQKNKECPPQARILGMDFTDVQKSSIRIR